MIDAEHRRVTGELMKKVQRKESVISKRKSREERAGRTHRKIGDKENGKGRPEIKDNNRHAHFLFLKELCGQMTVNKQHEPKRTKEHNKLELIWQKRDITRMRDSEILLQMKNMRTYAETEPRCIAHRKTKFRCEELESLEDIDKQRELTQLTYLRAKAGRDVVQNDVVDKVIIDFSSEVDKLAQISAEMNKLKIKGERSLKGSLRVERKQKHMEFLHLNAASNEGQLSLMEDELDNDQEEEQTPAAADTEEVQSLKYKEKAFAASIEPRDSLEHIGLVKKRKNTLQRSHAQRKKMRGMRGNQAEAEEKQTKLNNYFENLHKSLSKLCDDNRVFEKRSVHSYASAESAERCTNVPANSTVKMKLRAKVKVPRSKCKHYRNKNIPQRQRKDSKKYHTDSSVCHSELYELSAHNSLELLRQRQKKDQRLLTQTAPNSRVKFSTSSSSKASSSSSKSKFSSYTTVNKVSLRDMADDVPSTSKAAAKSCAVVLDLKPTYSTSDNETRCEPSTSSLEEMLIHIKTQLKQRHDKKHGISDTPTDVSPQKIQLHQQSAKVAEKSNKAKSLSSSRKRINKAELSASTKPSKPRKHHKYRQLPESVRIPLARNNELMLGQQNRCIEIAYATDTRSLYIKSMLNLTLPTAQPPNRRRRCKLKNKLSNVVQESEV